MAEQESGGPFSYIFVPGASFTLDVLVRGVVDVDTPQGTMTNPIHIKMEIGQKVLAVSPEGAVVEMVVHLARAVNGKDSTALPEEGSIATFVQDARGRTHALSGSPTWQGAAFAAMYFPVVPLHPGEGWEQETAGDTSSPIRGKTRYTFKGMREKASRSVAEFEAELILDKKTELPEGCEAVSTGTVFFDPKLGQVVEVDADSSFGFPIPVPGQNIQVFSKTVIRTTMKMRR
ncbi:MAG: hypothetical protein WA705_15870 [Candidatus Ozemobacteraceae bacterium]